MSTEKELRNKKIIDLNNQGKSIRFIANELGISKTTVTSVLGSVIGVEVPEKKKVVPVKLKGTEERVDSLVGWTRLDVNEYANDKSGEVMRIAWVKAKSDKDFGYFVKLGSVGKIEDIEVVSEEVKK
jgi:transposase